MQHVFLINPHAGKQNHAARIYAMAEHLRTRHGLCCTCLLTSRPGGAESLARETAQSGDPVRLYAETEPSAKWPTASPGIPTPP